MTNITLYYSALYLGFLHIIGILWWNPPIYESINYCCGIATSLLNHYYTSVRLRLCDRVYMWIGAFIDTYYILFYLQVYYIFGILVSGLLYFMSRSPAPKTGFYLKLHIASHITITLTHLIMMRELKLNSLYQP